MSNEQAERLYCEQIIPKSTELRLLCTYSPRSAWLKISNKHLLSWTTYRVGKEQTSTYKLTPLEIKYYYFEFDIFFVIEPSTGPM